MQQFFKKITVLHPVVNQVYFVFYEIKPACRVFIYLCFPMNIICYFLNIFDIYKLYF